MRKHNIWRPLHGACCVPVAFNVRRHKMGPEPLIAPFAIIGIICLLALCGLVIRSKGNTLATPVLLLASLFCAWGSQGSATWEHTITTFFMAFGVVAGAFALVLWLLALILRPFKPKLIEAVQRLRSNPSK
jgi:hypothetical protein